MAGRFKRETAEVQYIIQSIDGSNDEDLATVTVPLYDEHLLDDKLVEEYLTEEIEVIDDDLNIALETDPLDDVENIATEDIYSCNVCGIEFSSVQQHIDEFHSEQEVVLDVGDSTDGFVLKQEQTFEIQDISMANIIDEDIEENNVSMEQIEYEDANDKGGPSRKSYRCTRCSKTFPTLRSLSTHYMAEHKTTADKSLPTGPKEQPGRRQKKSKGNTAEVIESGKHTCYICNTMFGSAKSLKLHIRMHNPIKMKTLEDAAEHKMSTTSVNEEEYREKFFCNICDKLYDKAFEEIHMQMHNGEEKFNCSICNKLFPDETNLSMHMNAHQEVRVIKTKAELKNIKLPYACQYCTKEFARPYEKVKHERVHTGEKPYECEICGKCFRVSYCLTIHMRTHTDARPYICSHCNKRFKAHSVYNHHLLTHSSERNYKCPYCAKSFKTAVQLNGHKNSHTKPFSCTECNRPFGTLYAVRTHMETHQRPNNNMRHTCEICGAKYARTFALKDHIREQHKDVQIFEVENILPDGTGKRQNKRSKANNKVEVDFSAAQQDFISIEDERELEAAGQSILQDVVEQEVTIVDMSQFENEEEEVDGINW